MKHKMKTKIIRLTERQVKMVGEVILTELERLKEYRFKTGREDYPTYIDEYTKILDMLVN